MCRHVPTNALLYTEAGKMENIGYFIRLLVFRKAYVNKPFCVREKKNLKSDKVQFVEFYIDYLVSF